MKTFKFLSKKQVRIPNRFALLDKDGKPTPHNKKKK